jgi:hypothetical protein
MHTTRLGVDDRDVAAVYPAPQRGVRQTEYLGGQPATDRRTEVLLQKHTGRGQVRVIRVAAPSTTHPD